MQLTREKLRRIIISEMKKIMRPTMAHDDEDEDTEDDFLPAYRIMGDTGEFYDLDDEEDDGFSQEYIDMIMSGRPYPKD